MAKRKPRRPEELSAESDHLYQALNNESALPCVLIGAATLEQAIISLLSKHFISGSTSKGLFDVNGTLSDFSKCAKIAYCLGLIPSHFLTNLDKIADIRNTFAHSAIPLDFENEHIKRLCDEITLPNIYVTSSFPQYAKEHAQTAKGRFVLAVVFMWSRILLCALAEQHRPECPYYW